MLRCTRSGRISSSTETARATMAAASSVGYTIENALKNEEQGEKNGNIARGMSNTRARCQLQFLSFS